MALLGAFAQRLSRPAGRVLDAPIRDVVQEILKEHGYASPAEVQALRDELRDLRGRVDALDKKVAVAGATADQARIGASAASRAAEAAGASAAAASNHAEAARVEPRAQALEVRIAELEAALEAALEPDPRVAELEAKLAALQAAPPAAPPAEPEAPAAPTPVEATGCKVPGCPEPLRSKGFCSAHYQQWRRGTLKGFVTAEATALLDGKVVHLPKETVGALLTVQNGKIYADGRAVKPV